MKIMSQTKARKDFFKIAKEVNEDSVPVIATNKDSLDDVVILFCDIRLKIAFFRHFFRRR